MTSFTMTSPTLTKLTITTSARQVPRDLVVAASLSYLASCSLGAMAATFEGSTRRIRLLHHALYISTFTLSGIAASTALLSKNRAGLPLLGAVPPLALISVFDAKSWTHMAIAASAAPFYAASLCRTIRR